MLCDTRLYYMKCITFEFLKLKICNFSTSSFFNREKNRHALRPRLVVGALVAGQTAAMDVV